MIVQLPNPNSLFWVFRFNDNGASRIFAVSPPCRLPKFHHPANSDLLHGEVPAGSAVLLAAGFFRSGEAALKTFAKRFLNGRANGLSPIERKNGLWELAQLTESTENQ